MARVKKTDKFTIRGFEFETPDKPKKETVGNYDLPKKKQKWSRFEFTEDWYDKLSSTEKIDFVKQELQRMLFGFWFYNNGVLTYLTGIHYFYLQWFVMDDGNFPEYRDTDKRFFYFWRIIELMLWCLGLIYTKYRRQGASARGAAISLYYAITEHNILNGTISKTGQDSRDIFQTMIVNGFTNLPSCLKPRSSGFDRSSKELYLIEQAKRITKDAPIVGTQSGLNNRVNWLPTALNSYDGRPVFFLFLDEGAKWKECSVREYWPIAQKCLTKGARRYGLAYLPSTINEMEKGGGKEFHAIWKLSNQFSEQFQRDGKTPSGLVTFFLPAFDGFEGYIGEFGESIIDTPTADQTEYLKYYAKKNNFDINPNIGAKEFLERKRKMLEVDPDALEAEKRQNPFTEAEAFRTAASGNGMPQDLLHNQKERIERGEGPYKRRVTFFRRSVKDPGSDKFHDIVDWRDDPNGYWEMIWDFANKEQQSNKFFYKNGKKSPANTALFGMGGDPFSHTIVLGKGSKGAFYVYRKFNVLDQDNSDMFIVRYIGRPKLKSIFFDHAAMTAEYFGCKIGFEEINDEFYERFKELGLENYLVWTPLFMAKQTHRKKLVPGIPGSGVKAIETHMRLMVEYAWMNSHKMWFLEQIDDWLEFDISDRTIYDDAMASGYTLITCDDSLNSRQVSEERSIPVVKTYVITG